MGYRTIFDQVPQVLPVVPTRATLSDGQAAKLYNRNPNYTSAEGLQYATTGEKAGQDIIKLFAVNSAIKAKNFDLAAMILGRPVTAEDVLLAGSSLHYKANAPIGEIVKSFDPADVHGIERYKKLLDDQGTGYKIRKDKEGNYLVVSGPEIQKDGSAEASAATPSDLPLYEDPFSVLTRHGVSKSRMSNIRFIRKDDLLGVMTAFGITPDPRSNLAQLRAQLEQTLRSDHSLFDQLASGSTQRGRPIGKPKTGKEVVDDEEDNSTSSSSSSLTSPPSHGKAKKKKGPPSSGRKIHFQDEEEPADAPTWNPTPGPKTRDPNDPDDDDDDGAVGQGIRKSERKVKDMVYGSLSHTKLKKMLKINMGELEAGNDSKELKKDVALILNLLRERGQISKLAMNRISKHYITN